MWDRETEMSKQREQCSRHKEGGREEKREEEKGGEKTEKNLRNIWRIKRKAVCLEHEVREGHYSLEESYKSH